MIARLIAAEVASLRRSPVVWLALLLAVGGSALARMVAWIAHAAARAGLGGFPFVSADLGASDVAIPLALLAYLFVTSYLFGRDFEDGNIDLLLTAPVRRDAIVAARMIVIAASVIGLSLLGWCADVAVRAVLATSSFDPGSATTMLAALASALGALATLPLVAWAAVRLRGVLPALGIGIAIDVVVLALGGIAQVRSVPRLLPAALAAGAAASWLWTALGVLVFAGGLAAAIGALRGVDLFE